MMLKQMYEGRRLDQQELFRKSCELFGQHGSPTPPSFVRKGRALRDSPDNHEGRENTADAALA